MEYVKGHKEITTVTGKDFITAYDTVREWDEINTGNIKPYIKRQQSPFIALLHCAGILE